MTQTMFINSKKPRPIKPPPKWEQMVSHNTEIIKSLKGFKNHPAAKMDFYMLSLMIKEMRLAEKNEKKKLRVNLEIRDKKFSNNVEKKFETFL